MNIQQVPIYLNEEEINKLVIENNLMLKELIEAVS